AQYDAAVSVGSGGDLLVGLVVRQRGDERAGQRPAHEKQLHGQIAARAERVRILLRDQLQREVEHAVEPGVSRASRLNQRLRRAREELPRRLRAFAALRTGGDDRFEAFLLEVLLELRGLERDRALEAAIRDEVEAWPVDGNGPGRIVG